VSWLRVALRRRRARAERERGAALVELAICATLIITIAFGIVEFGNAWNRKMQVETASRTGARVGSSLGAQRAADYGLLTAMVAALNDIGLDNVNYVVVYNATTNANGSRPAACTGSNPTSQPGKCNVYTGAQLAALNANDFTASCTNSSGAALDHYWCPTDRQSVQSTADYLGVFVSTKYDTITGVFHSPFTLTSQAVMRLEPR
jgi:Flp pilus assembly protein TadG